MTRGGALYRQKQGFSRGTGPPDPPTKHFKLMHKKNPMPLWRTHKFRIETWHLHCCQNCCMNLPHCLLRCHCTVVCFAFSCICVNCNHTPTNPISGIPCRRQEEVGGIELNLNGKAKICAICATAICSATLDKLSYRFGVNSRLFCIILTAFSTFPSKGLGTGQDLVKKSEGWQLSGSSRLQYIWGPRLCLFLNWPSPLLLASEMCFGCPGKDPEALLRESSAPKWIPSHVRNWQVGRWKDAITCCRENVYVFALTMSINEI